MTSLVNRPGPAHYPTLLAKLPRPEDDPDLELPAGRLVEYQAISPTRAIGLHVDGGTFALWELERVKNECKPTKVGSYLNLAAARHFMYERVEPNPFL